MCSPDVHRATHTADSKNSARALGDGAAPHQRHIIVSESSILTGGVFKTITQISSILRCSSFSSSMLNVPELRLSVFRHFWTSEIYSLRLVCRAWYPEADQALWESIERLPTVLRFLPEDAWEQDYVRYTTAMITSADSIQDIYSSGDGSTVHKSPMTFVNMCSTRAVRNRLTKIAEDSTTAYKRGLAPRCRPRSMSQESPINGDLECMHKRDPRSHHRVSSAARPSLPRRAHRAVRPPIPRRSRIIRLPPTSQHPLPHARHIQAELRRLRGRYPRRARFPLALRVLGISGNNPGRWRVRAPTLAVH